MRKLFQLGLLLIATVSAASATDVATLKNGFALRHDHRAQNGTSTRLYLDADEKTFVDVSTADISSIEKEEPLPSAPAAALAQPAPQPNLRSMVTAASAQHELDPDFLSSVVAAESGGNPRAVSRKGAQGLMQLMPATAKKLGVQNSFDPKQNLEAGAAHLRALLAQYGNDPIRALAAYNAGAGRVQQYGGVPPYEETQKYVARIIHDFNQRKAAAAKAARKAPQNKLAAKAKPAAAPTPQGGN